MSKHEEVLLESIYLPIKNKINTRLKEFESIWKKGTEKDIFAELCFCLCTPQSKAVLADEAITRLKSTGVLYSGTINQIKKLMSGVRFPNNKSKYIFEVRTLFKKNNLFKIKYRIDIKDINGSRDWFVKNVKGMGCKEASHFLRNIGFGEKIAILDRHILKNMRLLGIIKNIPKSITPKVYFDLEKKLSRYSLKKNIPMSHLDLLMWYNETGKIFK